MSDTHFDKRRDLTAALFMAAASFALLLSSLVARLSPFSNGAAMFAVGISVIGPDSVLSGTISQDVAEKNRLSPQSCAVIAGLLNSIGSMGSIFASPFTAHITRFYSWGALFNVFALAAASSSAILFNVAGVKGGGEAVLLGTFAGIGLLALIL